jgi:phospholipase A2
MKKNTIMYVVLLFLLIGSSITQSSCQNTIASVRFSSALCQEEQDFLAKRKAHVKKSLENIFGIPLKDSQIPRIAVCSSGGGCRAAFATLGWIEGMTLPQKKKNYIEVIASAIMLKPLWSYLLQIIDTWFSPASTLSSQDTLSENLPISLIDTTTYFSSLSGSTWAYAGLLHSRKSATKYLETITEQLTKPLLQNIDVEEIAYEMLKKYSFEQPLSIIDIFGGILARKFLNNLGTTNESNIRIDSYKTLADSAQIPFPIHSAVIANQDNYEWIEFTPYEVGSTHLNSFVPTWAFGRKFYAGHSIDFAPPQSLGFAMGIWGSAMSINAKEFFSLIVEPQLGSISTAYLQSQFGAIASQAQQHFNSIYTDITKAPSSLFTQRISPAKVFNWAYGNTNATCHNEKTLTIIDAGIDFSLPVPPILRPERPVDIIIILDASGGTLQDDVLKLQKYASLNRLPLPTINTAKLTEPCSVHQDHTDPYAPIVIYIPYIKNSFYNNSFDPQTASFTSMFNFEFTKPQIELMTGLARASMQEAQKTILKVIKEWIDQHA